jgi:hypothetical protein
VDRGANSSGLHRTLKRMLVLLGNLQDLTYFGVSDFFGVNAAGAHARAVNLQHDLCGLLSGHGKYRLQDSHNEIHWRVIIVYQKHSVHRRRLCVGALSNGNRVLVRDAWRGRAGRWSRSRRRHNHLREVRALFSLFKSIRCASVTAQTLSESALPRCHLSQFLRRRLPVGLTRLWHHCRTRVSDK